VAVEASFAEDREMRIYFSGNSSGVFNVEYLIAARRPHVMLTFHDLQQTKKDSSHRKRLRLVLQGIRK